MALLARTGVCQVWVLIAQLLPRVLESSPRNLLKTVPRSSTPVLIAFQAVFAVGYGAWDTSVILGAKVFELALDAKYCALARHAAYSRVRGLPSLPCLPLVQPRSSHHCHLP